MRVCRPSGTTRAHTMDFTPSQIGVHSTRMWAACTRSNRPAIRRPAVLGHCPATRPWRSRDRSRGSSLARSRSADAERVIPPSKGVLARITAVGWMTCRPQKIGRLEAEMPFGTSTDARNSNTQLQDHVPLACPCSGRAVAIGRHSRSTRTILLVEHGSRNAWDRTHFAEGVGFEPTTTLPRRSGFQDRRTRPLCEPSRRLKVPDSGASSD
jgi:hypothetical protein